MNSFIEKRLRATITLADDSCTVFASTGENTLVVSELRMVARVSQNARQATEMDLRIWGMKRADMDALTVAWLDPPAVRDNLITLDADNGDGFRQVFQGAIIEAQPDFRSAPDVSFQILAMISNFQQISITPPLSYKGTVSIDVVGQQVAAGLGLTYVNGGTNAVLTDPYFPGSVFDQLRDACAAAHVDFYFLGDKLVFTPILQPLISEPAVVLSPTTGLLGYPMYSRRGLVVTAIYDPAFACATALEIQGSEVKGANGRWYPYALEHNLSSLLPNGDWHTTMQCNQTGA